MTQKNLLQAAGDGTAIPAGYVGEVLTSTGSATATNNTTTQMTTLTLSPGSWEIDGAVDLAFQGAASPIAATGTALSISLTSAFDGNFSSSYLNPFSSIGSARPLVNLRVKRFVNVPAGSSQIVYLITSQAVGVNLSSGYFFAAKRIA